MRLLIGLVGVALALTGCGAPPEAGGGAAAHGRYVGIGTYAAGALWSKMAIHGAAGPGAATTADDEHIIVVVDSRTGEVRECGDYTGVCVSMNPWTKAVSTPQNAPVALTKHLADLVEEQSAAPSKAR